MTLNEVLQKLGIKNYEDLRADERETYREMEEVLQEEMDVDKIKQWIDGELKNLLVDIANPDNSYDKEYFLKARIRDLTALSFFIDSPKMAKAKLEEYLSRVGINKPIK